MEKRILYFDCFSGISGDMTIGALLDLGIDENEFLAKINSIKIDEFHLEIKKGIKKGITGTDFTVHVKDSTHEHHNHTQHSESDGHNHPHEHKHHHSHSNHHHHEPDNSHQQSHDAHKHSRNINDIYQIIDASPLSDFVKETSKKIFNIIGVAEAKIHGKSLEDIHFHEVGAVDSIVDIIGSAICIEMLNVDEVHCSALNLGSGFVKCEHGIFPVPAPATLEILKDVPVYSKNAQKELTTPTGAAIVKAICTTFGTLPEFTIEKTGYGLGKRDLDVPNVLRVIIGKKKETQTLMVLETNIDNMNPEVYSYLFPKLLSNKALDVWISPILMKKNRPANILSVLCKMEDVEILEEIIYTETTTLGIRKHSVDRSELERKFETIETKFGQITIKQAFRNGLLLKLAPEYDDCLRLAEVLGVPLVEIYNEAIAVANRGRV